LTYYIIIQDIGESDELEENKNLWKSVALVLGILVVGHLSMLGISFCLRKQEGNFNIVLNYYIVFICCCALCIFLYMIKLFKNELQFEFERKVYLKDPKTGKIHKKEDDGTYIIQNDDEIVGKV